MELTSTDCKHVVLYLTEYLRDQLPNKETKEIEAHLKDCRECRRELEMLKDLSIKIDRLIPVVTQTYEKDFIYRLFINSKPEPLFFKGLSIILIAGILIFIFSAVFTPKTEFVGIKDLKFRAENMFKEDYYSNKQNQ